MNKINDGGPAFPASNEANVNGQTGMTLRDWFAGQALAGEMACEVVGNGQMTQVAERCYMIADAMLAEREKANV